MPTLITKPQPKSPGEISWLTVEQWQSHVESHADSSIFHHRSWLELLAEQYGFEIQIPAIVEDGQIRAAIPFLQIRNLWGGKKLISLPFTDYLPSLAGDQNTIGILCQLIQNDFRGRLKTVVIRGDQPVAGLDNESHSVRHELRTDLPIDEIASSFASAIKRNLRKGKRDQLEFQKRSDDAAIEIFYRLHVLTRRKLGVPVQSKIYFQRLHDKLIKTGLGFVGVVMKDNVPLAAVVLLGFHGRLVYKYAASNPSSLEHRPNDWLVYHAIQIAADEGYRCFDFGITDKDQSGLRRFKSKWGATESDIYYSYVLGAPDDDRRPSRAVRFAGEVIKRSPTVVCRALGKAFYRYSQ
jgi:lipid II:glycine glycyltransferase (peptidoglycan interpeptide bridge formation enzyme)